MAQVALDSEIGRMLLEHSFFLLGSSLTLERHTSRETTTRANVIFLDALASLVSMLAVSNTTILFGQ